MIIWTNRIGSVGLHTLVNIVAEIQWALFLVSVCLCTPNLADLLKVELFVRKSNLCSFFPITKTLSEDGLHYSALGFLFNFVVLR